MLGILKVENADCDVGGYSYVVCENADISKAYEWFETEDEAIEFLKRNNREENDV